MKIHNLLLIVFVFLFLDSAIAVDDKGVRYFKEGDFEKALEYYESILRQQIENKEAQFGLGTTSFQTQDFIAAEEAFKQVLESEDTELQSKSHYNLGNLYFQNQKFEESLAHYKTSIELNPTDPEAKWNYELVQRMMQQQSEKNNDSSDDSQEKNEKKFKCQQHPVFPGGHPSKY